MTDNSQLANGHSTLLWIIHSIGQQASQEPPQEQAIHVLVELPTTARVLLFVLLLVGNVTPYTVLPCKIHASLSLNYFLGLLKQRANGKHFGIEGEEIQKTS